MNTVDLLRDRLIDKLLTIHDKELLEAPDKILVSKTATLEKVKISPAQRRMLEMSEDDIKHGRIISQEEMDSEDMKWL